MSSCNTKPEVVWSRRGRHLENAYDEITPPWMDEKFYSMMQDSMPITVICLKYKWKKNSNMADVCFFRNRK